MATITSAQSGNWSSTTTWVGGVIPTAADIAIAATGHTVTIDTDITVTELQQAGTGYFTMGNGRTVTGAIRGNARFLGTVEVTSTTTATITGEVTTGSTGSIAIRITGSCTTSINGNITPTTSTSNNTAVGIVTIAADNVTLNVGGNVTGQSRATHGIYSANANSTIVVTGNVTGGGEVGGTAAGGINAQGAAAVISVTGTVAAANNTNSFGIATGSGTGASTITITGTAQGGASTNSIGVLATGAANVISLTGSAIAGSGSGAHAINASGGSSTVTVIGSIAGASTLSHGVASSATSNGVIVTGNLTDSAQGATAIYARIVRMSATNNGTTTYTNTVGYPNGTPVQRVSPNLATGMPAANNVRSGTAYGAGNELTGTLAVPPANAVASGVPVDNTTGTAALRPSDIAGIVGAQIAAALSSP